MSLRVASSHTALRPAGHGDSAEFSQLDPMIHLGPLLSRTTAAAGLPPRLQTSLEVFRLSSQQAWQALGLGWVASSSFFFSSCPSFLCRLSSSLLSPCGQLLSLCGVWQGSPLPVAPGARAVPYAAFASQPQLGLSSKSFQRCSVARCCTRHSSTGVGLCCRRCF